MAHIGHCAGDFVAGRLDDASARRAGAHLVACAHCRLLVAREKQRIHRLGAETGPEPSADLNDRILARTQSLQTDGRECLVLRRPKRRAPLRTLTAVAAAGIAVLGAVAYGSGPSPVHASPPNLPDVGQQNILAAWPRDRTLPATGTAPAASVVSDDLAQLQRSGWRCPAMDGLGYPMRSAQGFVLAGVPTLKLVFSDGSHTLTVFEQRPAQWAQDVPVDVFTGHAVSRNGFVRISGGQPSVWLRRGAPWQLAVAANGVGYTVTTDMPAGKLDQLKALLVSGPPLQAPSSAASASSSPPAGQDAGGDGPMDRMVRGFQRMFSGRG